MEIKNFRAIHDKDYITELIEEGEHVNQDFKFMISDSRKIARSIAAFANNDGGRLLVGVKDNGNIAGIRSEEEFYMIEQAAETYCKPPQKVRQTLYSIDGKYILKVDISKSSSRPVLAQDDNRHWQAYYRVDDENIQVPDIVVRTWKANHRKNTVITLSKPETDILSFLSTHHHASVEELSRTAHISIGTAEDIIVRFCMLNVADFRYLADTGWVIIAVPTTAETTGNNK